MVLCVAIILFSSMHLAYITLSLKGLLRYIKIKYTSENNYVEPS